ncbi:MAG: hypothetical protein ACK5OW_00680 [bacterium]|jgi:hypothetical protein
MLKEILKEKGKWSQGRVYLFLSIVSYYITLGILTYVGFKKSEVDMDKFKMIVDALEYAMTLFGGYVFGGKFIDAYKSISESKKTDKQEET